MAKMNPFANMKPGKGAAAGKGAAPAKPGKGGFVPFKKKGK